MTSLDPPTTLAARPFALSPHSTGNWPRWGLAGYNLNAWCRLPGNPFAGGLVLQPNHPESDAVSVIYGPMEFAAGLDTITFFLVGQGQRHHSNVITVDTAVLDTSHTPLAQAVAHIRYEREEVVSLQFDATRPRRLCLRLAATFDLFEDQQVYGSIRLPYLLAYGSNDLVDLFNANGSDKGTERYSGGGVPHAYALQYHVLFEPLRGESFAMLEIGLDDASKHNGRPSDAPSLRSWRDYFPHAEIYGYDINDFSCFAQPGTHIFQGDQGSPEDLARFLDAHGCPAFRLILDDGSHASSHQQISLAHLFGSLEPGGLYVIEDLNWQPFEEEPTTLTLLRRFQEERVIESPFIDEARARALADAIESVEIHRPNDAEFAVLRKRT